MWIRADGVRWEIDGRLIVRDAGFEVPSGGFAGLIGPNGSGKSSLLRCIYRVLRPSGGVVTLDEADVWRLSAREVARRMAVVPQESPASFEFSVEEIVMMGRSPHKGLFDLDSESDRQIVAAALRLVGLDGFAERGFLTLSGGEKQRVLLARALAQQARVLVLDEPTNHLDIRYQLEILELVRGLGVTALAALHDLNLAATYCDHLYLMRDGRIVAHGAPGAVLRPDLLRAVFGVGSLVEPHPLTGRPRITFFLDGGLAAVRPEPARSGKGGQR